MTKNYTLIIVSYESKGEETEKPDVVDIEGNQVWQGKKLYTVEHVQPLSGEEANSIMQS